MGKNVAVFVDVANIFYAAKAAGVDIDYVTLLKSSTAGRDFVRAYAYTGLDPDNENQRNFHSFLGRHGYKVVSKDIRKYGDGKVKANLDIELVVDMMKTARNLDVAVVVSGDGDFASAIRAVQEMGVRVEVVSFRGNTSSDLIDVADQFTDITQVARVEKGSTRSGRRVAGDDEDLSMTEVPEKQSEGTNGRGGRGRGRGRGRDRDREEVPAVEAPSNGDRPGLVALPGERLSKSPVPEAAASAAASDTDAESDEDVRAGAGDDQGLGEEGQRRRRRRGGRGRGRGRTQDEAAAPAGAVRPTAGGDESTTPFDEPDVMEAPPRSPRPSPFGSVWDTQLGTPAPRSGDLPPLPEEDEDLEEPEIPEYLIAERRGRNQNQGQNQRDRGRGGRGGGNRSAYAAALDRERYGRGGGPTRFAEPSRQGRGPQQPRFDPRRPAQPTVGGGGGGGGGRYERGQGRSGDPWSEVPPDLEAQIRAQLGRTRQEPSRPEPSRPRTEQADRGREPEVPRPSADIDAAPEAAPVAPPSVEGEAASATTPRGPRRRSAATPTAATAEPVGDATGPSDTGTAEAAPSTRRRTPRRATATTDAGAAPTADAETAAPEAPKRRSRRSTAADADAAAPTAADASPATDSPAADATAPKRRTTRRTAATSTAADTASDAGAEESTPKRRTTRRKAPETSDT